jgi:hypothetical protein
MELPITQKELDYIINSIKNINPQLYAKLWSHKVNNLKEKKNGFS